MSYFTPYSYFSPSGWDFEAQTDSFSNVAGLSPTDHFSAWLNSVHSDIPISTYSTLTGAIPPTNPAPQKSEVQTSQPAPQWAQYQLAQPVLPQPPVPAPLQLAQPIQTQSVPPVNPQPVALPHLGVQIQPAAPQPAINGQRRAAYVHAKPPARRRPRPAGTVEFCRVGGCQYWTKKAGKTLSRHRESHFPGQAGVVCPHCGKFFTRSSLCGEHLQKCNPLLWQMIYKTKGTQDSWGHRVGQDLINNSLVNGTYTCRAHYEL